MKIFSTLLHSLISPIRLLVGRLYSTSKMKLVQWLNHKNEIVLQGPNIDLKLSISGRTFINAAGQNNIPDGEIFTGPVENSVNGWVKFTYPAIKDGREVTGIELEFTDGRVSASRAGKNETFLLAIVGYR